MITIKVKAEFGQVDRQLKVLEQVARGKVMARTLNRIADQTKTEAVREIAREYNLTSSKVRERIRVRKAFARTGLAVEIAVPSRFGKRALNVISFGARSLYAAGGKAGAAGKLALKASGNKRQAGVQVKIKRRGAVQRGRGWFIITNKKTGGRFVAKRVGAANADIEPVRTIDVGQMFNANTTQAKLLANIRAKFPRELERQIAYELGRTR